MTTEGQRRVASVELDRVATPPTERAIVVSAPVALVVVDPDGRVVLSNPQAERLLAAQAGTLIGRSIVELLPEPAPPAEPPSDRSAGRVASGSVGPEQARLALRADGTTVPVEVGSAPIDAPRPGSTLISLVDLRGRQDEQRQLEAMLREKTVLLDEVHHRVKNNLQVITSLLSLQARGAPPEARAALAECRNRVHAMALTHELLHENADVARLHVGEYLSRLVRLLADSHRADAPGVVLMLEGRETPLYLELPRAIPCGLLVNELINEAYRRASTGGGPRTVTIAVAIDDAVAQVSVADARSDGEPALGHSRDDDSPDGEAPSLGMQLVPLLVDQLGGVLARDAQALGTRLTVTFPIDTGRRR